jgi:hypothetical protein
MNRAECAYCGALVTSYWQHSEHGTILCSTCLGRYGRDGRLYPLDIGGPLETTKMCYGIFPLRGQYDRYIGGYFVIQEREESGEYPYPYSTLQPIVEYKTPSAAQWMAETLNKAQT